MPRSSASRQTVLVPPASIPITCMAAIDHTTPERSARRTRREFPCTRPSPPRQRSPCSPRSGADVRYPTSGLMLQAVQPKAFAAIAAALLLIISPLRAEPATEVRALWVVRTTLTSPAAIATMVSSAKAGGFNTLLVQVRGRGDAYFQNGVEPRPPSLDSQPAFDPLATTILRAHDAGLQVHAWI